MELKNFFPQNLLLRLLLKSEMMWLGLIVYSCRLIPEFCIIISPPCPVDTQPHQNQSIMAGGHGMYKILGRNIGSQYVFISLLYLQLN